MESVKNITEAGLEIKRLINQQLDSVPDSLVIENRFLRFEAPLENLDLIKWLKHQTEEIKTYWRDRQGKFEMAGLGEADVISGSLMPDYRALFLRLEEYLQNTEQLVRYYGGMRFNKKHSSDFKWQAFTSYRFIVPKFEIFRRGSKTLFACNILVRTGENIAKLIEKTRRELSEINFEYSLKEGTWPSLVSRRDFPDYDGWKNNISAALEAFKNGSLNKIVLARRTSLRFAETLDPIELLWRLRLNNHRAYYFCFQPKNDIAFIGGTPEQLYYREEGSLHTEAVAGTRRRGKSSAEDQVLENELLNCEKDIREHRFVVDSIYSALKELCKKIVKQDKISILKLSRLQHLLMQFKGTLNENIQDPDILEKIHPTPAVGGVPSEKAMNAIEKIENFDRGWYAGPVGWISRNKAEFAVAIRSGLVYENELFLYSGAGIVEGSNAENEWEEIENKIAGFMNALVDSEYLNVADFQKS
ncbi:MAG: isochorismate synthase [Calditrichae bacterium]|nr:isochorismate synthase [Calditrichota bacterium]MCB9057549.1 isochorismate synthase [Calditrichia bacterium]